jgi:hypothetical protein
MFVDARGILRIIHGQGSRVGLREIEAIQARYATFAAGRKLLVFVDARGLVTVTLEARRFAAGEGIASLTERMAVLVGGPVSRTIGSFFLRVAQPAYPLRLFTEVAAADGWLLDASPALAGRS